MDGSLSSENAMLLGFILKLQASVDSLVNKFEKIEAEMEIRRDIHSTNLLRSNVSQNQTSGEDSVQMNLSHNFRNSTSPQQNAPCLDFKRNTDAMDAFWRKSTPLDVLKNMNDREFCLQLLKDIFPEFYVLRYV